MADILWGVFSLMIISGISMLLINAYRFVRIKSLHKNYREYMEAIGQGDNSSWDFIRRRTEIKDLFAKADVGKPFIPRTEPLGLGQIVNINLDVIDNMAKNDMEVSSHMLHLFHNAEGTFSFRIRQSINPIFWLETVIFLPSVTLGFVGVSPTSSISKIANLIGWILAAAGFLFALPDFYDFRDSTSAFFGEIREDISQFLDGFSSKVEQEPTNKNE